MNGPVILAFTGKLGSGKSTAAKYMVDEHGFERFSFAHPLKQSFAALFGITVEEIEEWKNDPACTITLTRPIALENSAIAKNRSFAAAFTSRFRASFFAATAALLKPRPYARLSGLPRFLRSGQERGEQGVRPPGMRSSMTLREGLQRYGTEAHRDIFGSDFWVDFAIQNLPDKAVCDDCRFSNEAAAVRRWGGKVIEIRRDSVGDTGGHASEAGIGSDPDGVIFNNGSIEDMYDFLDALAAFPRLTEGPDA